MVEMSVAELEAEMALELPDREVMHARINRSFNRNNVSVIFAQQMATALNIHSSHSTAVAVNAIVVIQNSGTVSN